MKTAVLLLWLTIEGFAQTGSPGYTAYRQGEALFEKGKFQESLIEIDRALGLDPRLIPALTLRAKLAMSMNRYDVAQEALEWALRVDPAAWYARKARPERGPRQRRHSFRKDFGPHQIYGQGIDGQVRNGRTPGSEVVWRGRPRPRD